MADPGVSTSSTALERYASSVAVRYAKLKQQHVQLKKMKELQKEEEQQELKLQQQAQRRQHLKGALQRREKRNQIKLRVQEKQNAIKLEEQRSKQELFKKRYEEKKKQKSSPTRVTNTWVPPSFKPVSPSRSPPHSSPDASVLNPITNRQYDPSLKPVASILLGPKQKKNNDPNKKVHFDRNTIGDPSEEGEVDWIQIPQSKLSTATHLPRSNTSSQQERPAHPLPSSHTSATDNDLSQHTGLKKTAEPMQNCAPPPSYTYGQRRHYRTVVPVRVLVEPGEVGSDADSSAGAFTW